MIWSFTTLYRVCDLERLKKTSTDSCVDIDAEISATQRSAADSLIRRELPKDYSKTLHSSLTDLSPSRLSPALQNEANRAGSGQPLTGGIDLSRYESLGDISPDTNAEIVKSALRIAYTNTTYLRGRQTNLALLEEHGKNAWLIGNSHTDDVQKRLETELSQAKSQSEAINRARKAAQEDVRGELLGLEETWKQGVGRIVETQLATEALRRERK